MGRIGDLHVAMYTNGNLSEHVNEEGYDVVTKDNEKVSVEMMMRMEPAYPQDAWHSHNSRKDANGCYARHPETPLHKQIPTIHANSKLPSFKN